MPAYAKVEDVQKRMTRVLNATEQEACSTLLEDAGVLIDRAKQTASPDVKKLVSCRMVIRALGNGDMDIPIGATQASQSALSYSQSWTIPGGIGEVYLSKTDKQYLGVGNSIGSYSPLEGLTDTEVP